MREIVPTAPFRREAKKVQRQGKDMRKMARVLDLLAEDAPIPFLHRDHSLKGDWQGSRELHIAPDWLLIYHVNDDTVFLERTGSHADLFG